jgi:hypothetical protein
VISTKSQILSVSFRTQRRSDVEEIAGLECELPHMEAR